MTGWIIVIFCAVGCAVWLSWPRKTRHTSEWTGQEPNCLVLSQHFDKTHEGFLWEREEFSGSAVPGPKGAAFAVTKLRFRLNFFLESFVNLSKSFCSQEQ